MSKLASSQQKAAHSASPPPTPRFISKTQKQERAVSSNNGPEMPLEGSTLNRSARAGRADRPPQGRRSVNSGEERPPSVETDSSFISKKSETTRRSRCASGLFQASSQEGFECPHCSPTSPQSCQACRNTRSLPPDHNLIRFLSYVIDFKLGRPSSPAGCGRGEGLRATQPARVGQSQRLSLKERPSECLNIHYGFFCDCCNTGEPIRGPRFHCLVCEDYDLCRQCHEDRGHRHLMAEIATSASYRHSLNCWQMLSQRQERASPSGVTALHGRIARLEQQVHSTIS